MPNLFSAPGQQARLILAYGIFFTVGILLHLVPALAIIPRKITDFFLLAANGIVLYLLTLQNPRWKFILFFLLAWAFTFAAEVQGVRTGNVFGHYVYGETLWIQLLEVPLIIPFNWVVLVLGMTGFLQRIKIPVWLIPFCAGLLLTGFDYTMEPVAMALDYWNWQDGIIPLQNYLAWFVIGALVSAAAVFLRFRLQHVVLQSYVLIQWIFFTVLNLLS